MKKNYFFTGAKGIGKSTVVNAIIDEPCFGFRTVKAPSLNGRGSSVYLLKIGGKENPSEENFLFECEDKYSEKNAQNFNKIGPDALRNDCEYKLAVLDELGPAEAAAEEFIDAVRKVLDSGVRVIGVLQFGDYPLFNEIKNRDDSIIITVTAENRDYLAGLGMQTLTESSAKLATEI